MQVAWILVFSQLSNGPLTLQKLMESLTHFSKDQRQELHLEWSQAYWYQILHRMKKAQYVKSEVKGLPGTAQYSITKRGSELLALIQLNLLSPSEQVLVKNKTSAPSTQKVSKKPQDTQVDQIVKILERYFFPVVKINSDPQAECQKFAKKVLNFSRNQSLPKLIEKITTEIQEKLLTEFKSTQASDENIKNCAKEIVDVLPI